MKHHSQLTWSFVGNGSLEYSTSGGSQVRKAWNKVCRNCSNLTRQTRQLCQKPPITYPVCYWTGGAGNCVRDLVRVVYVHAGLLGCSFQAQHRACRKFFGFFSLSRIEHKNPARMLNKGDLHISHAVDERNRPASDQSWCLHIFIWMQGCHSNLREMLLTD